MVFTINSKDFLKALKDARANISPRRNNPIMDYQSYWLSVEFSYGALEVSTVSKGGNLLTVNVPIQVVNSDKAPKSKVIVSQRLYGVVKILDSQDLTIDLTADKMEIQHACGVVRFPTLTGSDIVVCGPLTFGHDRVIFLSKYEADELRLILSTLKPFMDDGLQKTVTECYVVEALSFTEAEARIVDCMKTYISGDFVIDEIKTAPYKEIFFAEDALADKWYKAKLQFITIDEKTNKEKKSNVIYLTQATDLHNALDNVDQVMQGTMIAYIQANVGETKVLDVFEHVLEQKIGI